MSFVDRPLGGDAPPREEPAAPVVDLDPHALPSWRKSKGGPGLLRTAPVTCALAGVALSLCLAVNVLVGRWSEYPERQVRATTVAFGGHYEVGLRNGDWERLFLAPLLHHEPLGTLFLVLLIAAMAVAVERRLGPMRFGVLIGTAAPLTIAAALLRGEVLFIGRDSSPGLLGIFGALVGARIAVARRFPRPFHTSFLGSGAAALPWIFIFLGLRVATLLSGGLVGWTLARTFLKSAGVKTAGPPGRTVKLAAAGLSAAWTAAAVSASVGLGDRLAVAVPLDRVEQFLPSDAREGSRSYRDALREFPHRLQPADKDRLDEVAAEARTDDERRLTTLLRRAAGFDDEADALKRAEPSATRPTSNEIFEERRVRWRAFYDAYCVGWDRLRIRSD